MREQILALANEDCALRVDCRHGGRVASLRVFGEELLVGPGVDPFSWGCYPLAPWAGRIRGRSFSFAGEQHRLPGNAGEHAMHGTVLLRAWTRVDEQTIATSTGEQWPFAGRVTQRFTLLADALELSLRIEALDAPFPASAGFHPWFRRRLGRGREALLAFSAAQRIVLDDGMPTGEIGAVGPGPWDDCFTGVQPDPRIRWPGVLELTLGSSHAHWVIYDRPEHALCVEPWTAPPDALNAGAAVVTPGTPLELAMSIRWRRDDGCAS